MSKPKQHTATPRSYPIRNTYRGPLGDTTDAATLELIVQLEAIRATHRDKVMAALAEVEQAEAAEQAR